MLPAPADAPAGQMPDTQMPNAPFLARLAASYYFYASRGGAGAKLPLRRDFRYLPSVYTRAHKRSGELIPFRQLRWYARHLACVAKQNCNLREPFLRYENTRRFTDPAVLARVAAIESSPQKQEALARIKAQMQENRLRRILYTVLFVAIFIIVGRTPGIPVPPMSAAVRMVLTVALAAGLIWFVFIYVGRKYRKQMRNLSEANTRAYVNNFLLPVLREAVPDTEIDYYAGIAKPTLLLATPHSEHYSAFCHIVFGDSYRTEFCNLRAYHVRKDSDDHETEVTDFRGQVFLAHCATELHGHVRIVPAKKGFLGRKVQAGYDKAHSDERQIELEDIAFNGTYNVYCTDELSARRLLNPYLINLLDEWAKEMPVTVFMTAEQLIVSFYSGKLILLPPKTRSEIEGLSLRGEYQKIQDGLSNTYRLIDTIVQQM